MVEVLHQRSKDTEAEKIPNGDLNPERKIVQGCNPSPGSDLATEATERSLLRNLFCYLFPIRYQKGENDFVGGGGRRGENNIDRCLKGYCPKGYIQVNRGKL